MKANGLAYFIEAPAARRTTFLSPKLTLPHPPAPARPRAPHSSPLFHAPHTRQTHRSPHFRCQILDSVL